MRWPICECPVHPPTNHRTHYASKRGDRRFCSYVVTAKPVLRVSALCGRAGLINRLCLPLLTDNHRNGPGRVQNCSKLGLHWTWGLPEKWVGFGFIFVYWFTRVFIFVLTRPTFWAPATENLQGWGLNLKIFLSHWSTLYHFKEHFYHPWGFACKYLCSH